MLKYICLILAITAIRAEVYPTVIFHGMGDACENPGMKQITKDIGKWMGAYTVCIDSAAGAASITHNFENQAEKACTMIKADKKLQNTKFNVMGLSQGGLIARYIAEFCNPEGSTVHNMLTAGGPHMGVDKVPHCFNGMFCDLTNWVAESMVYWSVVQNHFGPAGYFRDINRWDTYLKDSVFLPNLNGQLTTTDMTTARSGISNLNGMMLVMFSEDTMIHPKETAQFGSIDKNGKLVTMENQDLYKSDVFGLKTLNEAGKIKMHTCTGDHLQFTMDDIQNIFVPFLKSDSQEREWVYLK